MADAYGAVVVTWKDCEPAKAKIEEFLNQYEFNNDGSKFEQGLWMAPCQYPIARPMIDIALFEDENGEYTGYTYDALDKKYGEGWDDDTLEEDPQFRGHDRERAPLGMLVDVADYLGGSGWLEIAACSNEKSRYVNFETIRIYADKRIEWYSKTVSHSGGIDEEREEWSPLIGFVNGEG